MLIGVGDDQVALSCSSSVQVWNLGVRTCVFKVKDVLSMAFKPGLLLYGHASGRITAWDLDTQEQVFTLVHSGCILSLALKGNLLASASNDYTCKVWDLTTFECTLILNHAAAVEAVAFLDDFIVTANRKSRQGKFEIDAWDYSGNWLTTLRDHTHNLYVTTLMVLSGGWLASFSVDHSVCIWQ